MSLGPKKCDRGFTACLVLSLLFFGGTTAQADDGYRLWLRYDSVPAQLAHIYRQRVTSVVVTVNANSQFLSSQYLHKVAAIAGVFRPYGVRVYLSPRFSAPIDLGGLKTADPLDASQPNNMMM